MGNTDNITQNRVNEIIAELTECRGDERDTQNQILQILIVCATLLGILLGASFFAGNPVNPEMTRLIFFLSIFIFCAAFMYILTLGIKNVLRYYYIQNLEDRLRILIHDSEDENKFKCFLHWSSFSAPIITRNPHHITSPHALIYFVSYSLATLSVGAFSTFLIIALFRRIPNKQWYDFGGVIFVIIVMILVLSLFLYASNSARATAKNACDTARKNLFHRLDGDFAHQYQNALRFPHFISYLIYPKLKDLQKPFLIVCGFFGGLVFTNTPVSQSGICNLILVIFIFDFLAYQARYQINDIRGMNEDKGTGRLLSFSDNDTHQKRKVQISLTVALIRIAAAIVFTITLRGPMRIILESFLLLLLIFTILYEAARTAESEMGVFFLVGSGYPLRFFLGFFTAIQTIKPDINSQLCTCLFLIAAFWAYGSCASILAWANEVVSKKWALDKYIQQLPHNQYTQRQKSYRICFQKSYFNLIQHILTNRYLSAAMECSSDNKIFPMRKRGRLCDPWNITYIIALVSIGVAKLQSTPNVLLLSIEALIFLCFTTPVFLSYEYRIPCFSLGIGGIGAGLYFASHHMEILYWYAFLCLVQLLFTGTYFLLRYQVQFEPIQLNEIFKKFLKLLLGKDAANLICPDSPTKSKPD